MSYDIRLFRPVSGEDPLATAQRDEEGPDGELSAAAMERCRAVFAALQPLNPGLELGEFGGGVQITAPEDGTGISLELGEAGGLVTLP